MRWVPPGVLGLGAVAMWVLTFAAVGKGGEVWIYLALAVGLSFMSGREAERVLDDEAERGSIEELLAPYGHDTYDVSDATVRVVPREETT